MQMVRTIFLVLFLMIQSGTALLAQDRSNRGKEFWLGYGHNVMFNANAGNNSQTFVLYISTVLPATVVVSIPGNGWSQTVVIPANSVDASVVIPKSGLQDARLTGEGIFNRGIHVKADVHVVLNAHQYGLNSSGAMMVMPTETYGYNYYSVNCKQVSNVDYSHSWFYVVAPEDNTRIEVIPSGTTESGRPAGQPFTVDLKRGEVFNVFGKRLRFDSGVDMTGSKILSIAGSDGKCHPVAVFSGSSRNTLCFGNGGDIMQQQVFPSNTWGTRYLTYHTLANANSDLVTPFLNIYRVFVQDPSTVVKRNGTVMTGLINNFYYEFSSDAGDYIEADKPILVAQFMPSSNACASDATNPYGDPEMFYLSPFEQGVKNVTFYKTRNQYIDFNYVSLLLPAAGISSLRVDGKTVDPLNVIRHPIKNDYAVAVVRLLGAAGQHNVSCDSAFNGMVFGLGYYESYGYNVGTLVNNLNAYANIKNTKSILPGVDSFTCINTPFKASIKVAYKLNRIHWKFSKATGLNIKVDSIINNPIPVDSTLVFGRKYYGYTIATDLRFSGAGNHAIPITYASIDLDNCSKTEDTVIQVLVKDGPRPVITAPGVVCMGKETSFTGTNNGQGFNLVSHQWDFPDGSQGNARSVKKIFTAAGNKSIRYAVATDNGCTADTVTNVIVVDLSAVAVTKNGKPCVDSTIQFVSSIPSGSNTGATWFWDFGDGQRFSSKSSHLALHAYKKPMNGFSVRHWIAFDQGCTSDTVFHPMTSINIAPMISAGPDLYIKKGTAAPLQASIPNPSQYQFVWSPSTYLDQANLLNPLCKPELDMIYVVRAIDRQTLCTASDTLQVIVLSAVDIPNTFTPNGDGINDTWKIQFLAQYKKCRMEVYNTAGQIIYQSEGYAVAWDGTRNGVPMPAGTYYYVIDLGDGSKRRTGYVTILR